MGIHEWLDLQFWSLPEVIRNPLGLALLQGAFGLIFVFFVLLQEGFWSAGRALLWILAFMAILFIVGVPLMAWDIRLRRKRGRRE